MKNLTISLDERLHAALRVDAARAGKSMSRYVADVLNTAHSPAGERRSEQLEALAALERFVGGRKLNISENGRMPTAEERNARG